MGPLSGRSLGGLFKRGISAMPTQKKMWTLFFRFFLFITLQRDRVKMKGSSKRSRQDSDEVGPQLPGATASPLDAPTPNPPRPQPHQSEIPEAFEGSFPVTDDEEDESEEDMCTGCHTTPAVHFCRRKDWALPECAACASSEGKEA